MTVIESVSKMQDLCLQQRNDGEVIAFVPTMGALHKGHLKLVEKAQDLGSRVVVSIFVNPTQFLPGEDYEKYPRQFQNDVKLLSPYNVLAVFHPSASSIYGTNFQTMVKAGERSQGLCGARRPGHFDGVLTVVLKLLNIVQPHFLIMGKKDYQQVKVIEKMIEDLNLTTSLVGVDTDRDERGLALSSRNQYLSQEGREKASAFYKALQSVRLKVLRGRTEVKELQESFIEELRTVPEASIEYIEFRTQRTFGLIQINISEPAVCLAAIHFQGVRLIDNIEIG